MRGKTIQLPYDKYELVSIISKFITDTKQKPIFFVVDKDKLRISIPAYATKIFFKQRLKVDIDPSKPCTIYGVEVIPNYDNKLVFFHLDSFAFPELKFEQSL